MDRETIYFYDKPSHRVKSEHLFLNNFFYSPFKLHGKEFPTVEHYYQASKFSDEFYERVRLTNTPDDAKKLARQLGHDSYEWDRKKDLIMKEALIAKFEQNPDLKALLLGTGNCKLVEDSSRDAYWGGVVEGSKNRLGILLEEIRDEYRSD